MRALAAGSLLLLGACVDAGQSRAWPDDRSDLFFVLSRDPESALATPRAGPFVDDAGGPRPVAVPAGHEVMLAGWDFDVLRGVDEHFNVERLNEVTLEQTELCEEGSDLVSEGTRRFVRVSSEFGRTRVLTDGAWRDESGATIAARFPRDDEACGASDGVLEAFLDVSLRETGFSVEGERPPSHNEDALDKAYGIRVTLPLDEDTVIAMSGLMLVRVEKGVPWTNARDDYLSSDELWGQASQDWSSQIESMLRAPTGAGDEFVLSMERRENEGMLVRVRFPAVGPPAILDRRALSERVVDHIAMGPGGELAVLAEDPGDGKSKYLLAMANFDAPAVELQGPGEKIQRVVVAQQAGQVFWAAGVSRIYRVRFEGEVARLEDSGFDLGAGSFISAIVDTPNGLFVGTDTGRLFSLSRTFERTEVPLRLSPSAALCSSVSNREACGREFASTRIRALAADPAGPLNIVLDECEAVLEYRPGRACDVFATRATGEWVGSIREPRTVSLREGRAYVGGLGNVFVRTPER